MKEPGKDQPKQLSENLNEFSHIKAKIERYTSKQVIHIIKGQFSDSTRSGYAAILAENNSKQGNIKVILFSPGEPHDSITFTTQIIDSEPKQTKLTAVRLDGFNNELVYFDTGIYFMGAGGGDIFGYLIDGLNKQVYSYHFILDPSNSPGIFISGNCISKSARDYFINKVRTDYPNVEILKKDKSF